VSAGESKIFRLGLTGTLVDGVGFAISPKFPSSSLAVSRSYITASLAAAIV